MANAKPIMTMRGATSDSRSAALDSGGIRTHSADSARTNGPHVAAAAAIDELLASEARANLQRMRASTRDEPVKAKARVTVPPARIVVRPSQSPAWKAPFFSLALVVGISTLGSAGALAYLLLRPMTSPISADADIRSVRDSVAQLRRQVADITGELATSRSAIETIRAQTSDAAVRAQDRADREQTAQIAKSARVAEEKRMADDKQPVSQPAALTFAPASLTASSTSGTETTGTISQPIRAANSPRDVIPGWHVRRAYDGVAVLEGKSGVIEVAPGQDVPGLGRIQEIKNENSRWQVLTSRGVILSGR